MKEQICAVQRMQDYIEKNIDKDITLADLSRESLFSPWYSYRLFREYTGLTVSDYIRRLRLAKSALKLKNEKYNVTDAAFDLGFKSADGYTRAFRREFGKNPSEYAKNPVPVTLFVPYGVKFRELRKENETMKNVQSVFVQLIKKPERKVIIKRGVKAEHYFDYCEEVGCDVWGLLLSMDSMCGEPVCMWLPDRYRKPNTSVYVQGVEVPIDYDGIIPEGFDSIVLPEAEYMMFCGEPFEEENYCEAIEAVQSAIAKYDPSLVGYLWDNDNPAIQLEPKGSRGYIELKAVKKK